MRAEPAELRNQGACSSKNAHLPSDALLLCLELNQLPFSCLMVMLHLAQGTVCRVQQQQQKAIVVMLLCCCSV
jgi:hypothetical protein